MLESGQKEAAAEVYKQDLGLHPNNVWALGGLLGCISSASSEAAELRAQLKRQRDLTGVNPPTASCACALSNWSSCQTEVGRVRNYCV